MERKPAHPHLVDYGHPYNYWYGDKFDPTAIRDPMSVRQTIADAIRSAIVMSVIPNVRTCVKARWSGDHVVATVFVPDGTDSTVIDAIKKIAQEYSYDRSDPPADFFDVGFYLYVCEESRRRPGTALGQAIRTARRAADLTQQELSDATGCSLTAISMYETGMRNPSGRALSAIRSALPGLTLEPIQ